MARFMLDFADDGGFTNNIMSLLPDGHQPAPREAGRIYDRPDLTQAEAEDFIGPLFEMTLRVVPAAAEEFGTLNFPIMVYRDGILTWQLPNGLTGQKLSARAEKMSALIARASDFDLSRYEVKRASDGVTIPLEIHDEQIYRYRYYVDFARPTRQQIRDKA